MIFDELCVLANGDIVCSCGDPSGKKVYGNVLRDRISAIYDGDGYRGMRRWQLENEPSAWCPVIDQSCGGRVSRPGPDDTIGNRSVRMLQLEPISHCNLTCPACPVTQFGVDPAYHPNRAATLPLDVMLDVVDQLPDLRKILFYNFGEPFLHPQAIDFLRAVRRRRPDVELHTSTNGLALTETKIRAIAEERLLDRIVFSIDGSSQETYAQYRVGGRFERALEALESMARACEAAGSRSQIELLWQYILFEWNDRDAELARARDLAQRIGVPIHWVLTHTAGASRRFREGAPELRDVLAIADPWQASTCDLRARQMDREGGVVAGRYHARIDCPASLVRAHPGERLALPLTVVNRSPSDWTCDRAGAFRLGAHLHSADSGRRTELPAIPLLPPGLGAGETIELTYDVWAPSESGRYELLLDLVEEGVTWFHERGSQATRIRLEVDGRVGSGAEWRPEPLVEELARRLVPGRRPGDQLASWCATLRSGVPTWTLVSWIVESLPAPPSTAALAEVGTLIRSYFAGRATDAAAVS